MGVILTFIRMIALETGEQVLMVVRRHWYALFRHVATLLMLTLVPVVFFMFAQVYREFFSQSGMGAVINFVFSLYALGLLLYAFIVWTDYYLDVWVITNKRLVDIEQRGLFVRTISELPMNKVQNVTIEIPGFMATLLKFGNLKVETASKSTFVIRQVPRLYEAKDLILKYAHRNNEQGIVNKK